MHRLLEQIEMVAPTDATVLIRGETGVGKELVAQRIHHHSLRHDHPMVTVNCTAVPRELFESEFFGHVRGAFSGAMRDRTGRFLLADGGTLFLDEVGDLSLEMQPKLLRVLEEGEFEAVGDDSTRHIGFASSPPATATSARRSAPDSSARTFIIVSTCFRSRYRRCANTKPTSRSSRAPFIEAACHRFHRHATLSEAQLQELSDYEWPGNVRELQNVIERAVIRGSDGNFLEVPNHHDASGGCAPRTCSRFFRRSQGSQR